MDSAGRESETLSIDKKIAIVGIGCRFPGGINNTNDFWETITQGLDCVQPHPPERIHPSYICQGDRIPGKIYTAAAGYLSQDVNEFDREFFQIPPEEAHHMDPQLRHLLEVTWEAFEDYGISMQELAKSPTGVYIGVMAKEYGFLLTLPDDNIGQYSATGNNSNMLSNRISYQFDLQGPSITFDTACSSSMYAIHHACDAIRKGECNLAIAGGVNLLLLPSTTIALCQARMLAKDGKCKSFDNRADGYSRGEGVGLVVLKSFKKALEDGDRIHAVIRGGAINNDGRTNGITTPNTDAQVSLLKRAYESAKILPQEVPYVEAHGTGTQAGDAAELTAIGRVLGIGRGEHYPPLTIGSVKSNFGHTEGAAGVASVIKVCLVLQKRQIPKLVHFQKRNEKIDWENFQINLPTDSVEWPQKSKYVAGCSSFGFGGANAHLVLEAPPSNRKPSPREDDSRNDIYPTVLFLSATSINALNQKVSDWVDFLKNADADADTFHNALQTAAKRATHHQHRLAVICKSYQHTIESLQRRGQGQIGDRSMLVEGREQTMYHNRSHKLAFVFSGMGTQWWAMGRQLMVSEEIFSNCIEEIDKLLTGFGAEWSLRYMLTKETDKDKIHRTDIAQPAICAIQIALAAVYRHLGIHPDVVIGHSVGEVAAAYVAGYLSLSDAVRLIYVRGKCLQETTGKGKMAAILSPVQKVSEAIVKPEYEGKIDIACINSRSQTVVSGEGDAVEKLIVDLKDQGIRCIPLKVNNAFHSFQQELIKQYFLQETKFLRSPKFPLESKLAPIHIKMISTVNGKYLNAEVLNSNTYWWNNIRQTVAFDNSLVKLLESGCNVFLEIGPHPALASPIKDTMVSFSEQSGVSYHDKFSIINSLRRPSDTSQMPADQINIYLSVAKLYVQGFPIQMNLIFPSERFSVATLPKYPWQREQYSAIADAARKTLINPRDFHPLLGEQLVTNTSTQQNNPNTDWISNYSRLMLPWLHHHKIQNAVVLPGAAFIETMIAAAAASSENDSVDEIHLRNVQFHKFHYSPKSEGVLFTSLRKLDERDKTEICIRTRNKNDNSWTLNATCDLDLSSEMRKSFNERYIDLDEIQSRCDTSIPCDTLYDKLAEGGVQIGDMFASVTSAQYSTTTQDALVFASLPRAIEKESQLYMFHPALLDAIFQLFAGFAVLKTGSRPTVQVPQAVKSFRILGKAPKDIVIHARENDKGIQEVRISDYQSGKIFAELDGVILAVVGSKENGGPIVWEKEWVAVDYEGEASKLFDRSEVPEKLEYFLIPDTKGVTKKLKNLLHNTQNGRLNEIHVCDNFKDAEILPSADSNARARHVVFMKMIDECSSLKDITKEMFVDSQVNKAIACLQSIFVQSIELNENVFFWIVTKGAVLACPSDKGINPLMSKALALVLTFTNEHPDIFVAAIDLPHDLSPVDCALCLSYFFDNPLLSENCLALRVSNDSVNESNIELYALRLNTKPTADLVFTKKSQEWMINLDEITQKEKGQFIRPWDKNKSLDHNDIGSTCSNQQIVVEAYIQQPYKSLGETNQSKSGFLFAGQVLSVLPSSDTEETKPAFVGFCRSHIVTSVVQTNMSNIVPVPLKVRPLDALVTIASCLPLYIALNNTFQNSDHHIVLLTSVNDPLHVKLIELLSNSTGCNIQLSVSNIDRKEERDNNTDGSIPFFSFDDVLSELKSSSIDTLIIHPNVTIDDKKMTPLLEKLRFLGTLVTFCSGTWKHPLIINQQIHVKTVDLEILRSFDHYQFLNGSITSLLQLFFPDNRGSYQMCPSSANISSINDASGIQLSGESVVCTNHTIPVEVSYRFGDSMVAFEADTFASYLVVGGSKGLGFEIVRWLANQGANVVYFTGRSSPDGDIAAEVKRLQSMLHTLEFIKCDASDENQTTQMLAHIKNGSRYPLRGIFHCAALFSDQRLQHARREDWCKVVLPKAYGTLLLHQITQKLDIKLSQFVVFSSIVEFLGNDGQGSYCCANAFLTSLCHARRLEGLPATVIAPGAVSSVGFAAREGYVQLFEARGMYGVNPADLLKSLSWSLGTNAMFGLSGFLDRQLFVKANTLFTHNMGIDHFSIYKKVFPRQLLEDIALIAQNINLIPSEVTDFFVQFVENRLGVTEGISSETSLGFYGLDSAMSWELSALITSRYNVAVSAVELLNESLKMSDLANLVCDRASGSEGNKRQRENEDPLTSSGTLWLQELGQLENANTEIVCFPCTGKGASMFDHWVAIFALVNVRLTVAQLPGWEGRMNEQPSHNLEYLVQELSSCVLAKFKQNRVAFVGCGIGALLAFEVALKLQSQHGFQIFHMFVVGWYPPSSPFPVEMMQDKGDTNKQSDIEKMALRFLDNRDLRQVQIFKKSYSNVQASIEICKLYKRMNYTPLLCDMTVFNGSKDPILIPKLVDNWRDEIHKSHSFQRIQINTDYKLLRNKKSNLKIASTIRNTLVGKPTMSRSTSKLTDSLFSFFE